MVMPPLTSVLIHPLVNVFGGVSFFGFGPESIPGLALNLDSDLGVTTNGSNGTSFTEYGVAGIVGPITSSAMVASGTGNIVRDVYKSSPTLTDAPFTVRFYAEAGTLDWVFMRVGNGTAGGLFFNAATGEFGTDLNGDVISKTATPLGDGWDVEVIFPSWLGGSMNFYIADFDTGATLANGTATDGDLMMYLDEIAGVPVLRQDRVSLWADQNQREQTVIQDSISVWTPTNLTPTTGQGDPLGGSGAVLYTDSSDASPQLHNLATPGAEISATPFTLTVYAKQVAVPSGGTAAYLRYATGSNFSYVNLDTGVAESEGTTTTTTTDMGGGWWRIEFVSASTPGSNINLGLANAVAANYQGDGTGQILLFQPQVLESKGTDVAQSTDANRPLWNGVGGGISFDGGGDFLSSNAVLSSLRYLHEECTVFIAMRHDSLDTGEVILKTANLTTAEVGYHMRTSTSETQLNFSVPAGGAYAFFDTSDVGFFGDGKFVITTAFDASDYLMRSNQAEETGSVSGLAVDTDPSGQLTVSDTSSDFDGVIYQILAYNRKLTAAEIAKVEAYLSKRWNIPFSITSLEDIDALLSLWDANTGVTVNAAAIDGDMTSADWAETDLGATEPSPGVYRLTLSGGAVAHRIDYSGVADNTVDGPADVLFEVDTSTATQRWWRILTEGTDSLWFDAVNGVIGSRSGTINSASVEDVGSGWVRFRVNVPVTGAGIAIRFQATSVDGGGFTTAGDGDFADFRNVQVVQNRVSNWSDAITGNDLAQGTDANRPLLLSDMQSGNAVARFDGASDSMQDTFTLNQDYEVVLVGAFRGPAGASSQILFDGVSNAAQFLRLSTDLPRMLGTASFTGTFPDDPTNWRYYGLSFDGASSRMQVGDSVFTGDVGTPAAGGITLCASRFFTNPAPADIGEVAIFDRVLTTVERKFVREYLEAKWLTFQTPRDLSGNVLWLDPTFVVDAATKVTHWPDKAGAYGYTATQTTAGEQPTLIAAPSIQFDGVADNLDLVGSASDPNLKCLHDGTGGTLVMVFKPTNAAASNPILASSITGLTDVGFRIQLSSTTGRVLAQVADGTAGVPAAQVVATNSLANGEVYVIAFRFDSSSLLVSYVSLNDGDREDLSDSSVNTPNTGDSSQDVALCGTPTSGASATAGELFDVIVYDRKLSDAELTTIENWASERWAAQTVDFWTAGVNVAIAGTTVTKDAGVEGAYDAGAFGNATLDYTSAGSISYVAYTSAKTKIVGLSSSDTDEGHTVEYGLFSALTSITRVYESGVFIFAGPNYTDGDVLSVELSGGVILYKKNGVTFYTSLVAPTADLHPDCTIANIGATFTVTIAGPGWS